MVPTGIDENGNLVEIESSEKLPSLRDWILKNPPKFQIGDEVLFEDTQSLNSFKHGIFYTKVEKLPQPSVDLDGEPNWTHFFDDHAGVQESDMVLVKRDVVGSVDASMFGFVGFVNGYEYNGDGIARKPQFKTS